MHKRIIKSSFFLLVDRGFRLAISFVLGVLIARFYGPAEFGQLNYVLATASVFGSLSSLGLDDIVPRDMAALNQAGLSRDDIQKTAFILRLIGGTAAYILVLMLTFYESGASRLFLIACLLALYLPIQAGDIYEYRLRVEDEFSKIAFSRSLAAFLANVLKALVLIFALPIGYIATAMTSEFAMTSTFFKLCLKKKGFMPGVFQLDYAKDLLARSWKIIFAGLLITFQARVEYFLIEKFLGWQEVGQYSAALKIFEIIDVVCVILVSVLMPKLASIVNSENARLYGRRTYLIGFAIYFLLIPVMILLVVVFPYVYGVQYAEAAAILPWLLLRPLFGMLGSIRNMFIVLADNYWYPALSSLCSLMVSILAGYSLIPQYGLYGAIASSMLGLLTLTILTDLVFYRKNSIAVFTCFYEWPYFKSLIQGSIRRKV
ncbi:oligosaccharide flippase family protein [Polynucleobacter sp. es-MAR-4]|uniref:oligosaccharide flippase family protein n=1 Tax=Polynucleobacter sp. es-MAR-4 TaxID=1855655 RepID=UPI001C0ADB89|nr:oligosaccharide flippase family protein [Polynucleobacter sp. es-MAR-4]MBU3637590.1 oligosaccharide flippase family protein [Polynucleobacter sp. es-MAR-4]